MSQVWCENFINIWFGFWIFTTTVLLEVLEKIHEKLFVPVTVWYILIIETLEGCVLIKATSIYYNQVKRFYLIILFHI